MKKYFPLPVFCAVLVFLLFALSACGPSGETPSSRATSTASGAASAEVFLETLPFAASAPDPSNPSGRAEYATLPPGFSLDAYAEALAANGWLLASDLAPAPDARLLLFRTRSLQLRMEYTRTPHPALSLAWTSLSGTDTAPEEASDPEFLDEELENASEMSVEW